MSPNYCVMWQNPFWVVKRIGCHRSSGRFDTKRLALQEAKRLTTKTKGAIYVMTKQGTVDRFIHIGGESVKWYNMNLRVKTI